MSCRFVTPCLDIARTYSEPPEVYDGLSFYVPQIKPLYQGSVQIADAIYEVWSPNSTTIDYYPGAPLAGPLHAQLRKPCYHDGRLGPHDWTLHPQHYYEKYPWFGFCRNPQNDILEWTSVSPELVPLPVVWVHSMTARGKGFINPHYLSAFKSRAHELRSMVESWKFPVFMTDRLHQLRQDRPRYPNGRDIGVLLRDSLWEWEELVIVFTSIQRGLREMEAWLTMMSHWGFRSIPSPVSIPPVSSGRVGIWLNGASEGDGLWLLGIGIIPVYVIHRFAEDIESPPSSSDSSVPDWRSSVPNHRKGFVHGTRAEQLNSSQGNPYLRFLRRRDLSNVIPFTPHQLHSSVQVNCDERYRSRSASWGFHRRQLEQSDTDHSEPERRASTLNSAQQKSRGKSGSGTDSPVFTVSSCLVRQPHGNMGSASGVHDCSLAPSTDSAKLTISVYAPPRQPCQDDSISLPRELDPEHGKAVDRSVEDNCPPLQEQNSRSAPPQNLCYEGQSVWAKRISACHVEEPFKVADIVPTYSDTTYSHSKDFLFLRCRAPVENDEEVLDWGEDDIELPDDSQPAPPQIPPYDSQSASVESLSMAVDAAPTNPAITQKNSGIEFLGNQHVAQQNASRPFISDHILDDPIDGGAAVEDDSRSAVFPALAQGQLYYIYGCACNVLSLMFRTSQRK